MQIDIAFERDDSTSDPTCGPPMQTMEVVKGQPGRQQVLDGSLRVLLSRTAVHPHAERTISASMIPVRLHKMRLLPSDYGRRLPNDSEYEI
jgi:hypothetical protein